MLTPKMMSVFFDNEGYPFKDAQRTVRYPIVGNAIAGSNNVTKIRFYVDQIGGTENVSWVVVSKLPNGKLGYEPISDVQIDEELGEKYIDFDLNSYYTSVKGDLYLALRGYEGEITFEENDDGVYEIVGDPLIQVTGTIKLPINYSPMVNTGTQVLPTDVDRLIASLSQYLKVGDGIQIFTATYETTFAQLYAQTGTKEFILFYGNDYTIGRFRNATSIYMETISSTGRTKKIYSKSGLTTSDRFATLFSYNNEDMVALGQTTILYTYGDDTTDLDHLLQDLDYLGGHDQTKPFIFKLTSSENGYEGYYLCQADTLGYPNCHFVFRQIDGNKIFQGVIGSYQTNDLRDFFKPLYLFYQTTEEYVDNEIENLQSYVDDNLSDCIKKLDSLAIDITSTTTVGSLLGTHFIRYNANLYLCSITQGGANYGYATIINLDSPTNVVNGIAFGYYTTDPISLNATIASILNSSNAHNIPNTDYVDNKLAEFLQREYTKVNTTTYPTIESFLASIGEEGYIYLYPINVSDESQGYYQYIWEGSWVSLGRTNIDLSDYYTKTEANALLSDKADKSTTYTKAETDTLLDTKQENLVSGTNIKSLNGESLLGSGNISYDNALNESSTNAVQNKVIAQNVLDLKYRISVLEEAIVGEDTLSYTHLSESLIPQLSDNSYPIIQSGGLDVKEIKGRSFVYNQLVQNGNFVDSSYWTTNSSNASLSVSNNKATISAIASFSSQWYCLQQNVSQQLVLNHRYLVCAFKTSNKTRNGANISINNTTLISSNNYTTANVKQFVYSIVDCSQISDNNLQLYAFSNSGAEVDDYSIYENAQIFDLTQSGIDSATTVDEAIALLQQNGKNPYEYNEYNVGEIIDSKPTAIVSKGFNVWDEQWERGSINSSGIVVSSTTYCVSTNLQKVFPSIQCFLRKNNGYNLWFYWYDKNGVYLPPYSTVYAGSGYNITIPNNAYWFRIVWAGTTYNNDICINLSSSLNGTYKPYKAPITYSLDVPVLRSAGSVQDNNEKVNIGVVDLGTLSWTYSNGSFYATISNIKSGVQSTKSNIYCSKYRTAESYYLVNETWQLINNAMMVQTGGKQVCVNDSAYTDAATFKTAMSGVMLNYELATPTDQPSITLPENIEFEKGGSLEILYDDGHTTPCDFVFDTAVYKPIQ